MTQDKFDAERCLSDLLDEMSGARYMHAGYAGECKRAEHNVLRHYLLKAYAQGREDGIEECYKIAKKYDDGLPETRHTKRAVKILEYAEAIRQLENKGE